MDGLEDGLGGVNSPGQEFSRVEGGSGPETEVAENGYGYWAGYQVLTDSFAEKGELRR